MTPRDARALVKAAKAVFASVEIAGLVFDTVRISKREAYDLISRGAQERDLVFTQQSGDVVVIGRRS